LDRREQVQAVLLKSKRVKSLPNMQNILIVPDRTPRQLDYYRQLKVQLNERQRNGETNLTIKYISGQPKIVHLN
jgi:hypothetical protein